jgi:hypothetical protein
MNLVTFALFFFSPSRPFQFGVLGLYRITSISTLTRPSGLTTWLPFQTGADIFSLCQRFDTGTDAHTDPYPVAAGGFFPRNKAAGE